jgi:Acetyltransferase (GNAT) domain
MTKWTPQRVLAAAAEWVWVPPDADEVHAEDYRVIRYPPFYGEPTQVAWSRTDRPLDEVIDEVLAQVRRWNRPEVSWWTSAATRPAATEAILQSRGAVLAERVEVLAHDMTDKPPPLPLPADVRVEAVSDETALAAMYEVETDVWHTPAPDQARFAQSLRETLEELAAGSSFRVVAWLGDEPIASGGCSLVDGVARLWGAGTRAAWQHRGAYRAVLAERLRLAREHGATLALVKGRIETSGPILRRVGFTSYGEERCYRLPAA